MVVDCIRSTSEHLRQGKSRPDDIVALGMGTFLKDTAIDCFVVFGLAISCLSNQAQSSDFSLGLVEKAKFTKDRRSSCLVASYAIMRLISLAMNHRGLRGPHFQRSSPRTSIVANLAAGGSLLHGPFAVSHRGALQKIMRTWGSTVTWDLEREHAGQIVRGMQSFFCVFGFLVGMGTNDYWWGRDWWGRWVLKY